MKKYLPLFVVMAVLLAFLAIGLVILSNNQSGFDFLTKDTNGSRRLDIARKKSQSGFKNEPVANGVEFFKILYRNSNDAEGRTVIYQKIPIGRITGGSGLINSKSGKLSYAVGLFKGWQTIDGTRDKYLKLFDPINNKNLPLFRVAFEPSNYFNDTKDMTTLAVENIEETKNAPHDAVTNTKKQIASLSGKIDQLLKLNDAVLVTFVIGEDNLPARDVNDNLVLKTLTLRRNNGLADLNKELSKL